LIRRASDRLGSAKFFRIYEKLKSLRFELEMKRKLVEPYQNSFFSYSFEEFEDELVQVFMINSPIYAYYILIIAVGY